MGSAWIRRGPWWLYVLVIGGLNVVRLIVLPPSRVGGLATVGLFVAVLIVSFGAIEVLRLLRRRTDRPR